MLGFALVKLGFVLYMETLVKNMMEDDDGYYGSCFSVKVFALVEDMESGTNALHDFEALLLWDVR